MARKMSSYSVVVPPFTLLVGVGQRSEVSCCHFVYFSIGAAEATLPFSTLSLSIQLLFKTIHVHVDSFNLTDFIPLINSLNMN